MQICVLGPLLVEDEGRRIAPGGPRQRAVLLYLSLHPNEPVPSERLLEEIWGDDPLASAPNALQAAVSRLRRLLPDGRLTTTPQGYVLHLAADELDAGRFLADLTSARDALAEGRSAHAADLMRQALQLWRGPALQDVRFDPFAQAEVARLDELHLAGVETLVEAELARGAGAALVPELQRLTRTHPLRETLHGHLMLALYRSGRQAEALDVYHALRATLDAELGVEPSPALAALMGAVLRQEAWLDATDAPPVAQVPVRRLVSAVQVVLGAGGGTGDPEALQVVRRRVEQALGPVADRHGGTLGDVSATQAAVVFGVPVLHEDDAQRACRAALEATRVLAGVGDGARAGVASGDVLLDPAEPAGYVGGPVEAARVLAAAAPAGRVAVDGTTYELAADWLTVDPLDGGPSAPQGFLLATVAQGGRPLPGPGAGPLLGRAREQAVLDGLLDQVRFTREPHLVTLLGEAGVGKSRLAQDFCARHGDAIGVFVGRCPPYGEGVTWTPLRDVVAAACGGEVDRPRIESLCAGRPDPGLVADRLLQAFGSTEPGAADAAEIAWAARHLLAAVAGRRPTVVVLDDLSWALPTFLDLVESLVPHLPHVPLLVVATARPELLEDRAAWPGTRLTLDPLQAADAERLAEHLTGATRLATRVRTRVVQTSGGNPLFLEHLVAAVREHSAGGRRGQGTLHAAADAGGEPLPPTVSALLATRLDRLGPAERAVLGAAAVLGADCSRERLGAVLAPGAAGYLDAHLRVLSGKALLAVEGSAVTFRHALVREAAYRMLPKSERARLHERCADLLDQQADRAPAVGRQLARAAGYLRELGDDRAADPLARRAVVLLVGAAERAATRGDADVAARDYELASALVAPGEPSRPGLLTALGGALFECGRLKEARDVLTEAVGSASGAGERARAEIELLHVSLHLDPDATAPRVDEAVPRFEAAFAGDDEALARTALLEAATHWNRAQSARAEAAWRVACERAGRAGDVRRTVQSRYWLASAALWGPTPAAEGIVRCREHLEAVRDSPTGRGIVGLHLAGLLAMDDDVEGSHRVLDEANALIAELGSGLPTALTEPVAFVHALVGDIPAAEAVLRAACEELRAIGERASLATVAAVLARIVALQGPHRHDEAQALVGESWAAGGDHDVSALVVGRSVLARVQAGRGAWGPAVEQARSAVALARTTDFVGQTADALVDLGDVLALAGDEAGARSAHEEAREVYAAKGNRPAVRTCERLLARVDRL